ncbi:MAG: flippase-like domain-containing protein [Peptococcaceae bacterium]|nr:flippase-like domain-containing protein [Peptococcaceae bacterium]
MTFLEDAEKDNINKNDAEKDSVNKDNAEKDNGVKDKVKKRSWGKIILAVITLVIMGVVFYAFFTDITTPGKLVELLESLQPWWIAAAVAAVFLSWMAEAKILQMFINRLYRHSSFLYSFRITMIGQLYNAITPFSTGGQPAQFYHLAKDGHDAGDAASVQALRFIIYQITLVTYCLIMLIWRLAFFREHLSGLVWLTLIGFIAHAAVIVGLILFTKSPRLTGAILRKCVAFLRKIRLVRRDDLVDKIEKQLEVFHDSLNLIDNNLKLKVRAYVLSAVQLTLLFTVPYFIYRSFGLNEAFPPDMLAAMVLANLVYSFVPLPGAAGAAEGSFVLFFNMFFKSFTVPAMLVWRIITYYFCIIFGGIALFFSTHKRPVRRRGRRKAADH